MWSHLLESARCDFFRCRSLFSLSRKIQNGHVLERREQLRPVLKAAVDAEALKRGASREEVSRLHDELARGAPVLESLAKKKAIWNRRNEDHRCFMRCVLAHCLGVEGSPGGSGQTPQAARAPSSTPSWPAAADAAPRAGSPL